MYQFPESFRVSRFKRHYRDLFPAELDLKCKSFLKTLDKLDLSKPVFILNPNDYMKQSFAYLFMKKGFVDYKLMSAYSLLDIYLGNSEEIKTVMDVSSSVVCLYLGYGEFENKRQSDVVIQLINNQVMQGKTVWVYCKLSSIDRCNEKYPGLVTFFKNMKYGIVPSEGAVRKLSDEL